MEFAVEIYTRSDGRQPFEEWFNGLRDSRAQRLILLRIARLRSGNLGDSKGIARGLGLRELRIAYGPGYRIYFGKVGSRLVLLLGGGAKRTQTRDIERVKKYFLEYKST